MMPRIRKTLKALRPCLRTNPKQIGLRVVASVPKEETSPIPIALILAGYSSHIYT